MSLKDFSQPEYKDKDLWTKLHYDFLSYDLQTKALRYSLHEYVMRRLYKKIIRDPSDIDKRVHRLILDKQNDPAWLLTSESSHQSLKMGQSVEDFTEKEAWCDKINFQ